MTAPGASCGISPRGSISLFVILASFAIRHSLYLSPKKALVDPGVSINPAVAQALPMRARLINLGQVQWVDQHLLLVAAGFRMNLACSACDKTLTPTLES